MTTRRDSETMSANDTSINGYIGDKCRDCGKYHAKGFCSASRSLNEITEVFVAFLKERFGYTEAQANAKMSELNRFLDGLDKPSVASEIPDNGLDTLVLACDEVLRLMGLWKRHYAHSQNCDRAEAKLREEIRRHLTKQKPVSVSLEKCAIASCYIGASEATKEHRWHKALGHEERVRLLNQAKAVLESAKAQGAQFDVKD